MAAIVIPNRVMNTIVAIDPGESRSGMVVLVDYILIEAFYLENSLLFDKVTGYNTGNGFIVLVEDIQPYLGRLSPNVIETSKFIGELKYRLKMASIEFELIKRSEIKQYVFDSFPELVHPKISKRIERKGYVTKDGELRKPQFMWVNDQLVQIAMREHWKVPKPWSRNKYGLESHSWQALGVATCFINRQPKI